jgi:hypothetical protein
MEIWWKTSPVVFVAFRDFSTGFTRGSRFDVSRLVFSFWCCSFALWFSCMYCSLLVKNERAWHKWLLLSFVRWVSCEFAISGVLPGTTLMAIYHYTPVSFQSYSLIFRLCLLTFLASTLRIWVPSWLLQFLEHKTRFDGRNGSDLLMICKALERLSIKNATWCLWENPNEKSPVSQDMLIKMVRNHQTLQWFRSNALSADNVAMLQQERPEITFVLNYTIITRCWKISRMTSWLLIRRNS